MAGIMTPETLEPEEMMNIPVAGSGVICRVVSGYANFYEKGFENVHGAPLGSEITGDVYPNDDDKKWTFYDVHMVVGPKWHDVRDVSPIAAGTHQDPAAPLQTRPPSRRSGSAPCRWV